MQLSDGVPKTAQTRFASRHGSFELRAYDFGVGREHAALFVLDDRSTDVPLVRVQSACMTGTAFGAMLCDCEAQLHLSLDLVARAGHGCVVYLDQEGRGHGLVEKVVQLARIAEGADTVDAALMSGERPDVRTYEDARAILADVLPAGPVRLLTNNPSKLTGLRYAGLDILERIPIETAPTEANREYLLVKKHRMGHLLTLV